MWHVHAEDLCVMLKIWVQRIFASSRQTPETLRPIVEKGLRHVGVKVKVGKIGGIPGKEEDRGMVGCRKTGATPPRRGG